jgi:hypothetical protein
MGGWVEQRVNKEVLHLTVFRGAAVASWIEIV